jgi:hypothetical protein
MRSLMLPAATFASRRACIPYEGPNVAKGPGCAKTRAFNLRVESSSQFGQSENQNAGDGLSEEANRENGSTLSWLAHVSTRPGSGPDTYLPAVFNIPTPRVAWKVRPDSNFRFLGTNDAS